ncbi:ATP-grasp domain-containing protein [Claveliimonas bilis]|uniref:ATP-grasp domain-containing protein n=1 Tax=Claveliimonas bilis TaxID=3028070 RepID=UPI00292EEAA3|nr:ATP-grasp domain-containing protein [Claveliimonas bilis]
MKKIMILGASILQLPAIEKAKKLGLSVVVVDMNPNAIGFELDGIDKEIISTIDTETIVKAAKRHKIDGIMTLATDMPMRSVAAVAKELNLIGINEVTALRATNKAEMRKALEENHVPVPMFFKVSNLDEFKVAVKHFSNQFMIKPADSSGSRGIYLANIDMKLEDLIGCYNYSKQYSRTGDVVVEEYMIGPEVSVETLTVNGKCHVIQITDKLTTGAPHFVEMGHSQPTRLSEEISERISQVAIDANKAIGIENGPSHTEIIVTEDGPKIVELGARLGGDNIATHLVPLSTGIDIVECCIRIALGENPDLEPKKKNGSAIRYFNQKAGCIAAIDGIKEAKRVDGIKQISIVYDVGEDITDIENSAARMGFVIADGKDANDAIKKCEEALEKINIVIE